MAHPYGPVNEADDLRAHRRAPVRIKDAIHTEIAIMHPFTMIPSIGIAAIRLLDRVIYHFPHTATHQVVIFVDFLPIAFGISRADSHRMRIFTQKIRPVVQALLLPSMLSHFMHIMDTRVHFAAHIIGLTARMDRAFIMNRKLAALFQEAIHRVCIIISSCLIAQRPHDNRSIRMNLVPLI